MPAELRVIPRGERAVYQIDIDELRSDEVPASRPKCHVRHSSATPNNVILNAVKDPRLPLGISRWRYFPVVHDTPGTRKQVTIGFSKRGQSERLVAPFAPRNLHRRRTLLCGHRYLENTCIFPFNVRQCNRSTVTVCIGVEDSIMRFTFGQ